MDKRYITGTIFLFIAVFIATVFAEPKYRELVVVSESLTSKENEFKGRQSLILEIEKINKEFAPALEDLERIDKYLPKNINVSDLLLQMDYISSRNGLVIKNIEFSPSTMKRKVRLGEYLALEIKMDLSGTHSSFLNFSEDIRNNLHLMDIVKFSVSTNKVNSDDDIGDFIIDPILNFNLVIEAYYQK